MPFYNSDKVNIIFHSFELVTPRRNALDELAIETLLGSLGVESAFSLEIAGDECGRHFLIRAGQHQIEFLKAQLQSAYDQIAFRDVQAEQDPAREDSKFISITAQLILRRPVYLPLRTYRNGEFEGSDPMRGILGALSNFQKNERALVQLVLRPAPPNWADAYQGSARQIEQSVGGQGTASTMQAQLRAMAMIVVVALCLCVGLQVFFVSRQGLSFALVSWGVFGVGVLAACVVGLWFLLKQQPVDPRLVQQKIALPAYDVALRLVAYAESRERAQARLKQLATAYRQFNLSSGNAFVLKPLDFNPRDLSVGFHTWWQALFGRAMRLNTAELASLWHLPYGEGAPLVERTLSKRILPMREQVAEGVCIGHSVHHGERIPVHLAPDVFQRHMFLVAKTQKGKSTLMGNLATAVMADANHALAVMDPHGDLVRSLLGRVTSKRTSDVIYLDFSDPQLVVGLNLIDVAQGRTPDKIVSNIIHIGELIWADYWGPRMEDAFRMGLLTLLAANEKLHARGAKQFTLLDIPTLFQLPNLRDRLLTEFVDDPEILRWWTRYFDALYESLKLDIVNPVMTKIHRFSTHRTMRNIVGQSASTVSWREIFDGHRILLVNTATGILGQDAAGLLGAVILDSINATVREQSGVLAAQDRARGMIIIDEFQSIPGVDYAALLAELQKMGANFVLATQTLKQLDALSPTLAATILANVDTLFTFQVSAEDAYVLSRELDEAVTAVDIINQPSYSCYVKTQRGRDRLPVMHVETLPPQPGNERIAEQVLQGMLRYARPIETVEAERRAFMAEWYGDSSIRVSQSKTDLESSAEDDLFGEGKTDAGNLEAANQRPRRSRSKHQRGTEAHGSSAA
ncbi:MAG: type IV secretion system DNA-binding domain-containing protein [Anaerolineae bacterium]|nr:type IV secretion system DNA-binding domain-containing protein [Anaerolineae bacterium]